MPRPIELALPAAMMASWSSLFSDCVPPLLVMQISHAQASQTLYLLQTHGKIFMLYAATSVMTSRGQA